MKTTTIYDIMQLKEIIRVRKDRVESLERVIRKSRGTYKTMTDAQLNEAIRDVTGMRREINEHKKWIAEAQKKVDAFYAPAVAM